MAMTDTAIRTIKPDEKPFKMYDHDGLYLLVNPGGSKLWRWRFRFDGKEKLMALGEYPIVSLGQARESHLAARRKLAGGIDPMAERKAVAESKEREAKARQSEAENSFEMVARKWWGLWAIGKSARHTDTVMRRLEADVFSTYGHKFIDAVTAADIREVMLAVAARDARDVAKRVHETTGQIFRYAIAHGIATRNPAADFKPGDILAQANSENFARVDSKELPDLLVKMEGYDGDALTRLAMRLMAYTFVRTSELIESQWPEFDLGNARWDIPAERMKMDTPHIVPLSRQAVGVLRALMLLTGKGKFVLPGANDKNKPMSNNTILFALYRLGYKGRMTGHGFRGLASTILHENEFADEHIELQLAHQKRNKVAAAYNHAKYLTQRTAMMQWWADYLDAQQAKYEEATAASGITLDFSCSDKAARFSQATEREACTRSTAHCLTSDLTQATAREPRRTGAGKSFSRINA
jgi:integrase